jgi:hypothetical protein
MLYGIQRTEIDSVWPHVRADIECAVATARGKFTVDDMLAELRSGECQLWIWKSETAHALCITQVHSYKRNKVCWIRICVGENFPEWSVACIGRIEDWARAQGCDAMEFIARPGWSKVMKQYGYDMTHQYLEKELR